MKNIWCLMLYSTSYKILFIFLIFLSYSFLIDIDLIDKKFTNSINKISLKGQNYYIINYENWKTDKYIKFNSLKMIFLDKMAMCFFIIQIFYNFYNIKFIELISLIYLYLFKLYFTMKKKRNFSYSFHPNYKIYYQILLFLHFISIGDFHLH